MSDPEDIFKVSRLNGKELLKAKMKYIVSILELMESWNKEEPDVNVTSLATATMKIMLFSADVTLVRNLFFFLHLQFPQCQLSQYLGTNLIITQLGRPS